MDQPIIEVIITLTIRNEYSGGIGGGIGLKTAVNVPYLLIARFPEGSSSGTVELRLYRIPTGGGVHVPAIITIIYNNGSKNPLLEL
jgi:hypothetical protein